ncbi:MAG: lipopolysaccharide biosynthesis protein [Lachnospiraceae bacterium]|nr:lipopolysaccharide biosynthesis protein [Lachnospiraceae bacterium]
MTLETRQYDRSGFIWNLTGSTVYSVVNMLLGTMVIRMLGGTLGGIFFFAFSTVGQHIYTVAYFCMRPIHVMDITRRYSFGDYRHFRLLTSAAALAAAVLFGIFYSGFEYKTVIIVILAVYKILDAIADVYESEFQRDGRLDITGKSMTVRTLFAAACFTVSMLITKDLLVSCIVLVGALLLSIMIYCTGMLKKGFPDVIYTRKEKSEKELFDMSWWLFAASFIDLYIFAASKYAVDAFMGSEISGYYSTIFVPTSAILLMSNYVIRPVLTKLSEYYENKDFENISRTFRRLAFMILGLTVFGMIFSWLFGIQILTLLVGNEAGLELMKYRTALVIIIAGGGMYAMLTLIYYIVIILKKQRQLFITYVIGIIPALVVSIGFVRAWGVNGGAVSYFICITGIALALYIIAKTSLLKSMSEVNND